MKTIHYTSKSYFLGFILSVILTIIPFYIIGYCDLINKSVLLLIIISCAIIQIYVHLILFLHLNNISNQIWNIISLVFTIFVVFVLILGSIWIMEHLHHNLII